MKNWFRAVRGTVRLHVRCARPERLLNLCAREGVPMTDARCPDAVSLTMCVPASAFDTVSALAERCGGAVTAERVRGGPRLLALARRRWFALALLGLICALTLFSSAFLWEIHVTGNETIPTGTILRALDECGFSCGKCWLRFQSQALQSELISRLPALEWVSFQIRGSRAEVIVYEAEPAPEILDNEAAVDLVAARSGVIVKMTTLQGAPMVSRGELVLPGQVLISGTVTDRQGQTTAARALGTVRARTWYEITACLPRFAQERTGEGRRHSRWALIIGKKRVNFYQTSGIPAGECDTIYHEYVCAVPGVFRLPLSLVREEQIVPELRQRERTEAEARALLEQTLRQTLSSLMEPDGEMEDLRFTPGASEDAFYLTLRAECEQNIERESQKGN